MPRASSSRSRRRFPSTTPRSVGCTGGSTPASVVCTTRSKPYSPTVDEGHRSHSLERFAYGRRVGAVRGPPLPRKPPLPFVPGHRHLHHFGWPRHAYGPSALLRRIPVFLLGCHPDDYLTRLRGERSGDGTESFDARAVFGQQQHPLSRIGHERRPVLAERHLFTNCIGLEPTKRLGDRDLSGQDLESLVVRYPTCRLYGRRELVGDVYFGQAVFGATYCDLLNELFDQFAPSMPRLVCVLFECLQAAAQGPEPRGRVLCRCGVLLFSGEAGLGRLYQHLQVRDTVLDVQKVNLQLFLVQVPRGI